VDHHVTDNAQEIKYAALQRRALLSANPDTGRLPVVDDRGHPLHLSTRKALQAKGLVIFVPGADYYDLTELGVTEARRLQVERRGQGRVGGVLMRRAESR
jgi:hypothetical protein